MIRNTIGILQVLYRDALGMRYDDVERIRTM